MYYTKPDGTLYFHDEGKKFIQEKHGLTNLINDCDICVYSLTPKGHTTPAWLIVKVTIAKCMNRYLEDSAPISEHCVVMIKLDYEKFSPKNLFGQVRDLKTILLYYSEKILSHNSKESAEIRFYRLNRFDRIAEAADDFFSIEVEPDSDEEGARIYLRDKAHFAGADKK